MEMLNISTSERPLMLQEASPDPGSRHRELCRAGTAPGEKKPGFHTSSVLSWPSCSATTRELAHLISSPFQASVEAALQISKAPRSIHSQSLHRNRHRHRQICRHRCLHSVLYPFFGNGLLSFSPHQWPGSPCQILAGQFPIRSSCWMGNVSVFNSTSLFRAFLLCKVGVVIQLTLEPYGGLGTNPHAVKSLCISFDSSQT